MSEAMAGATERTPLENLLQSDGQSESATSSSSAHAKTPLEEAITPTLLYDADANQRFGFEVLHSGKRYQVHYEFGPITDDSYVEYDRQRNVRMAADGTGGIDSKSNSAEAAAWLGRKNLIKVEGWGPPDGSKVKDRQLADAMLNGPLVCIVDQKELPLGDAEADRPWEDDEDEGNTYPLRAFFSGREVVCTHVLADADADQEKRWGQLIGRTKLMPGERLGRRDVQIPSRVRAIGKLYDEMKLSASGYADATRVPLHHKVEVMEAHMGVQQELLDEGK